MLAAEGEQPAASPDDREEPSTMAAPAPVAVTPAEFTSVPSGSPPAPPAAAPPHVPLPASESVPGGVAPAPSVPLAAPAPSASASAETASAAAPATSTVEAILAGAGSAPGISSDVPSPVAPATESAGPQESDVGNGAEENGDGTMQGMEAASEGSSSAADAGFLNKLKGGVAVKVQAVQQKISESERVQQGVQYVKQKTSELAESEQGKKVLVKLSETQQTVTEKTKQGLDYVKEKTRDVKEKTKDVWGKGRGSIERAKAKVANSWQGSAKDTLGISEKEAMWKEIKVQGAEEMTVPARQEHTCAFHVVQGATLRWTFRVKDYDIGFGVRMRVQEWGGAREEDVLPIERYDAADTISGSWVADEDRTIILAFDNRYSKLRGKTVAYYVGTEKPPIFVPEDVSAPAASSSEPPAGAPAEPAAPAPVV